VGCFIVRRSEQVLALKLGVDQPTRDRSPTIRMFARPGMEAVKRLIEIGGERLQEPNDCVSDAYSTTAHS